MEFLSVVPHYLVPFVLVLTVLVFVHEFGHYYVARRCGIRVETFSIGFGREIFGWTDGHGTRWKFSLIPLGGYVKMFGDVDPSSAQASEAVKALPPEQQKEAFFAQRLRNRALVVVAGPASNYLFAFIVLAMLFATAGKPFTPPVATAVQEDGAAAAAGLAPGDRIISLDGSAIDRFEDLQRVIGVNTGTPVTIVVDRSGEEKSFTLTPRITVTKDRFGNDHAVGRIGVTATGTNYRQLGLGESAAAAGEELWQITSTTLESLGQMIIGVRPADELGGPLRIAQMSGQVSQTGWLNVVWFLALLSINLGLVNLLPIPLLDGGHLIFYAIEGLRGRALSERAQEIGFRFGMAFVLSLMVFATVNDLVHLDVFRFLKNLLS